MRKRTLKIDCARSMSNGIKFYSKRHKGFLCISSIDEDGNIKTEWTKNEERENAKSLKTLLLFVILYCFFGLLSCLIGIRFATIGFALFVLSSFMIIARGIKKDSLKFHSAEHMVLNGYHKLKRVPSLEEIYSYSRFLNGCSTNGITQIVLGLGAGFISTYVSNQIVFLLILTIIDFILLECGLLNFLQYFTTEKPTEKELLVAIEGMRVWLEHES